MIIVAYPWKRLIELLWGRLESSCEENLVVETNQNESFKTMQYLWKMNSSVDDVDEEEDVQDACDEDPFGEILETLIFRVPQNLQFYLSPYF